MIAGIFGFLGAWMLTIPALVILFLIGVIFEHNNARGWAVFTAIVAGVCSYFFFNVSLMTISLYFIAYVFIGLLWSIWRYKRHADGIVAQYKNSSDGEKQRALSNLHLTRMLGTITAWVIVWPFSMVENLVGDVITMIQTLISKVFRAVYHRIYDSAVAALSK